MHEFNRRLATITLPRIDPNRTEEWDGAMADHLGAASLLRLRDSEEGAAIAGAYITEALRVFRQAQAVGMTKWPKLAETLGLYKLTGDEDTIALNHVVRELYKLWCLGDEGSIVADGNRKGWLRCWHAGKADEAAEALLEWISPEDPPGCWAPPTWSPPAGCTPPLRWC